MLLIYSRHKGVFVKLQVLNLILKEAVSYKLVFIAINHLLSRCGALKAPGDGRIDCSSVDECSFTCDNGFVISDSKSI